MVANEVRGEYNSSESGGSIKKLAKSKGRKSLRTKKNLIPKPQPLVNFL